VAGPAVNGIWKTTGYGLLPLVAVALAAAAGIEAAQWLLARAWWILGSAAACWTAAAFLAPRIARRVDANSARAWVRETGTDAPLFMSGPRRELPRTEAAAIGREERPAITPAVVLNFYGADSGDMAARVLRSALPGSAGDVTTEEE
jgi:hypothetical protein